MPGICDGRVVIVTGGGKATLKDGSAGSIGYGIDIAFAKEGANLVITGRNVAKLEAAKESLEAEYGVSVLPVAADVSAGRSSPSRSSANPKSTSFTAPSLEINTFWGLTSRWTSFSSLLFMPRLRCA